MSTVKVVHRRNETTKIIFRSVMSIFHESQTSTDHCNFIVSKKFKFKKKNFCLLRFTSKNCKKIFIIICPVLSFKEANLHQPLQNNLLIFILSKFLMTSHVTYINFYVQSKFIEQHYN